MQKNIKFLFIFLIIVFLLLIFSIIYFFNIKIEKIKRISYQQGWDAAKIRLYEKIGPMANWGAVEDSLLGEIREIRNGEFVINIQTSELLTDPNLDQRIVIIDEKTEISRYQEKNTEKYNQELELYKKKYGIPEPPSITETPLPNKYEIVSAYIDNLKSAQYVEVYAYENIRTAKTFTAKEIIIKN